MKTLYIVMVIILIFCSACSESVQPEPDNDADQSISKEDVPPSLSPPLSPSPTPSPDPSPTPTPTPFSPRIYADTDRIKLNNNPLIDFLLMSADDVKRELGSDVSESDGLYAKILEYQDIEFYFQNYSYSDVQGFVVTGIRIYDISLLSANEKMLDTDREGIISAIGVHPSWEGNPYNRDEYVMEYMLVGESDIALFIVYFDDPEDIATMATIHFYDDGRAPLATPWWIPRETLSVQLADTILNTSEWVHVVIIWTDGTEATVFERCDYDEKWVMSSDFRSYVDVEPSFRKDGTTLVLSLPAASQPYRFHDDFTGSFGDESFSWYAYIES